MTLLELVLWIVAGVVVTGFLLLMLAGLFVFLGAMSMPEDMYDDGLGDRK
jgi:hypothetical protein